MPCSLKSQQLGRRGHAIGGCWLRKPHRLTRLTRLPLQHAAHRRGNTRLGLGLLRGTNLVLHGCGCDSLVLLRIACCVPHDLLRQLGSKKGVLLQQRLHELRRNHASLQATLQLGGGDGLIAHGLDQLLHHAVFALDSHRRARAEQTLALWRLSGWLQLPIRHDPES